MVKLAKNKGFSLTELLVSIAIIAIIFAIVLANYRKFDSTTVFTSVAYDVGLTIRKAQSYGVSVRGVQDSLGTEYKYAHGVYFNLSNPSYNNKFIFFADADAAGQNDGLYNSQSFDCLPTDSECMERYTINKATITNICVNSGSDLCSSTGSVTSLDISFLRPEPDAIIKINDDPTTQYNSATITLTSVDGTLQRNIVVNKTGQISITTP